MSLQVPLYSNSSVSSFPSNGVRTPRDTVMTPRLRLGPTAARSQALRRPVPSWPTTPSMSERKTATGTPATSHPSCPTTPSISERKIATGTPVTSQPGMRISSNASTGAKYSSTPSVSAGIAMNRTSPATAKVLSGGVNLGASSAKALPATNPSGRAAPSRPVLRTVITPRVDRFAAKGAQAEANQAAQQTGMAPPHTNKADQSAQRNGKALEPPEIEPPISDEAKLMLEIPRPFPAPAQPAATSQVQAPPVVKMMGAAGLSNGLKSGEVSKIVDKMEKALNADAKANMMPAPEQATATSQAQAPSVVAAALSKDLKSGEVSKIFEKIEAALNADEKARNSSDAGRKTKLAQGLRKAPSVVKDAEAKPPVETQQVGAGPVPISQPIITSPYTTTTASAQIQPKSLRQKSNTRQLLGKVLGRTFNCFDDSIGDCQAVPVKDVPQYFDVPAMGA